MSNCTPASPIPHPRTIALIGAHGMLASMLRASAPDTLDLYLYDLPDFDITNSEQVNMILGALQPDIIINCAAFTQ
ncbi:MAG: sugar nucleotide-binding protein, partial [Thermodesulfobacteriota bacterium]|nr:sugar nucleotide-binding protein [Thermodesulfobacteriota bacterium]